MQHSQPDSPFLCRERNTTPVALSGAHRTTIYNTWFLFRLALHDYLCLTVYSLALWYSIFQLVNMNECIDLINALQFFLSPPHCFISYPSRCTDKISYNICLRSLCMSCIVTWLWTDPFFLFWLWFWFQYFTEWWFTTQFLIR